jgi:hypothetical protein
MTPPGICGGVKANPGREVFFEPHSRLAGAGYPRARRRWLLAGEACAGGLFLCDAAATLVRLGWERYAMKHWRLVFSGTAALIALDSLVCFVALCFLPATGASASGGGDNSAGYTLAGTWRWRWHYWLLLHPTRCLRPLLLVAHHRPMRHLVSSMLRTLPRLASTIALVGVVIVAGLHALKRT